MSDLEKRSDRAIEFLNDAARYFATRPTGGEDMAHWSNVQNAENCRDTAELVARLVDALSAKVGITAETPISAGITQ